MVVTYAMLYVEQGPRSFLVYLTMPHRSERARQVLIAILIPTQFVRYIVSVDDLLLGPA
jgi:hypothetical protein